MKTFLIATAALSLVSGAAYAQGAASPAAAPTQMVSPATNDNTAKAPQNMANPTPSDSSNAPAQAGTSASPAEASATSMSTSSSSTSTVAANTPSGSPPAAYPVCTSKKEDRCVNRYQATRTASTMHMKKTKRTMDTTTSGDQAPAAAPST